MTGAGACDERLGDGVAHAVIAPSDAGPVAIVDLSANENPFGPSPQAVRAMIAAAGVAHRYPDSQGAALKAGLAKALGVKPENIVLGNGSSEVIELTARAVLDTGGHAIIGWPSFQTYRSAVSRAGAAAVLTPLIEHAYDLDAMAERAGSETRLVIIGNPNNPTGLAITGAALDRFLDRLPSGVIVCVDEAYGEYVSRQDFPNTLDRLAAGRPLIVVRTLSKAYGLAGLRIGYAIAPEPLARRIDSQRQRFNTSCIAQAAALAAIDDPAHLARIVALNAEGRDWLASRLSALGLRFLESEANFLMVKVGDGARECQRLKALGLLVKPLDGFGLPDYIRVSVGRPEDNARLIEGLRTTLAGSAP
jgi:histidinol-phosphate aminotransferase